MNQTVSCPFYQNLSDALANLSQSKSTSENLNWQKHRISGGCIHDSAIFSLSSGERFFVKQNTSANFPSLAHEAEGLIALTAAGCIAAATPLALGLDPNNDKAFLVLAVIESKTKQPDFWSQFGRALAQLHTQTSGTFFGWQHHDYSHRITKRNIPLDNWLDFFRQRRLQPQLELAQSALGPALTNKGQYLIDHLEKFIEPPSFPQLIHGDLWSGNFMIGENGLAILIDPAVYYGHGEADLAMTHLFGGFPPIFYSAYQEINPLSVNYKQHADIYNLFYLLNHLNLFGTSYLPAVKRILEDYGL